ncbi:Heme-degrading monooxygenase HmoB [Frondihabitans sp. 762G35]|uniref:antibiotic biosynthesis monooxygenase family protein n=1 Tax=Frondihabitans sp. 762G35 TaxID=1446794 RepID=UPI000D21D499|nr:Heme-degrading monooxygenase HmoB [Frondihabitans sp. 762G35]
MSVVKINAIHVPEGRGPELEKRFAARKHSVDGSKGFEGFQLLRPVKGDDRYFVVTTWDSEESFAEWAANGAKAAHAAPEGAAPTGHGAPAHAGSETASGATGHGSDAQHGATGSPQGPKPVATGADLLEFEVVEL